MTPEHRRVAAFLLQAEDASRTDRGRSREVGELGVALPARGDAGAVGGANPPATNAPGRAHGFAALAALIKLMIVLLALVTAAPQFQKFGQKAGRGSASAALVSGRSAPGVPVGAATESKSMQSVKRSVMLGCAALPLLFASSALAQGAVDWKVSDGGNGHWYGFIETLPSASWIEAKTICESRGGYLATVPTSQENAFVMNFLAGREVYLGGYQPEGSCEPLCNWTWISGEPWIYSKWNYLEPNNAGAEQDFLRSTTNSSWDDIENRHPSQIFQIAIEWSADCNGDGIVDYGQILSGELADANGNGVPDCCEDGTACVSSLVANASFEAGSPLATCASESITAPNMLGSAWQVSAGAVDRVRVGTACASSTQPKFGDYAIDLCGTPASSGAIRQIVATIPGHKYRCTFWLSGDASAGPATKKVHAKVGNYIDLSYTFACSGTSAQNWVANQFEFTARGASETLEFAADNGASTGGPMLDAINLADITTHCVGDIDASGEVDGADISLLLLNFGPCTTGQ